MIRHLSTVDGLTNPFGTVSQRKVTRVNPVMRLADSTEQKRNDPHPPQRTSAEVDDDVPLDPSEPMDWSTLYRPRSHTEVDADFFVNPSAPPL